MLLMLPGSNNISQFIYSSVWVLLATPTRSASRLKVLCIVLELNDKSVASNGNAS
jgi:hypothetical protein